MGLNLVLLEVGSFRQEGSQITLPFARPAHVAVRLSPMRKVHLGGAGGGERLFGCVECKALLFYLPSKRGFGTPLFINCWGGLDLLSPPCLNALGGGTLVKALNCFPALVMSSKTSAKSSEGRVLGNLSEGSVSLVPE